MLIFTEGYYSNPPTSGTYKKQQRSWKRLQKVEAMDVACSNSSDVLGEYAQNAAGMFVDDLLAW